MDAAAAHASGPGKWDDGLNSRHLAGPVLYQLSYVRLSSKLQENPPLQGVSASTAPQARRTQPKVRVPVALLRGAVFPVTLGKWPQGVETVVATDDKHLTEDGRASSSAT